MEKHDGRFQLYLWNRHVYLFQRYSLKVNYTFKAIFKTPCDENQVFNVGVFKYALRQIMCNMPF